LKEQKIEINVQNALIIEAQLSLRSLLEEL